MSPNSEASIWDPLKVEAPGAIWKGPRAAVAMSPEVMDSSSLPPSGCPCFVRMSSVRDPKVAENSPGPVL